VTKFILVGGYIQKAPDGGKAFCEELVKDFPAPVKILDCMFARREEVWNESFAGDKELFAKYLPTNSFDLKLAEYEHFIEQVEWADAVFLRGGSSSELVDALKGQSGWTDYLEGKTVAGTSAGADALSTYYYGLDHLEMREGLGLLPVKVIPHFKSDYHGWEFDWDRAYAALKAYKEDLPVHALGEGQFEVLHK
jgi:hypothetical protein